LEQWKIDMHVQPLSLESGEPAGDGEQRHSSIRLGRWQLRTSSAQMRIAKCTLVTISRSPLKSGIHRTQMIVSIPATNHIRERTL
jgi:hypothetical protein